VIGAAFAVTASRVAAAVMMIFLFIFAYFRLSANNNALWLQIKQKEIKKAKNSAK